MTPLEATLNSIITCYKSSSMVYSAETLTSVLNNLNKFDDMNSKYDVLICKLAIALVKKRPDEVMGLIKEFSSFADNEIQAISIPVVTLKENNLINTYMRFMCFASRSLFITGNSQYAWFIFRRGKVVSRQIGHNFPVTDDRVSIGFYGGMPTWN